MEAQLVSYGDAIVFLQEYKTEIGTNTMNLIETQCRRSVDLQRGRPFRRRSIFGDHPIATQTEQREKYNWLLKQNK